LSVLETHNDPRGTRAGPVAPARASAGLDVLVEAEEVGLVVDPLESREPLVVALAIGRAHAVLPLVAEEVEVDAPARVGLQRVEEVACPGDVPFRLGIVLGQTALMFTLWAASR
jgi:hypothetical protein